MKKLLQIISLSCIILLSASIFAQDPQSNFINYQAVATDASGAVMANQDIAVNIAIKVGATTVPASYVENHSISTDANGVFSLQIGNGTLVSGNYSSATHNTLKKSITVSINGTEIGTTELLAVPYAIRSGDAQWQANGNDIQNLNSGTVKVGHNIEVGGNLKLQLGVAANEISTDATLAGNSDKAIPTEKAVKTYITANGGASKINDLSDAKAGEDTLFLGEEAGKNNSGSGNTGVGFATLQYNTTGKKNTANGAYALRNNTTGKNNTANGVAALFKNTTGSYNTAYGTSTLVDNRTGKNNTAVGWHALVKSKGSYNVALGNNALATLLTGNNNIGIGADARVPNTIGSHQIRIGNTQITYAGVQVAWTITSDAAWKDDIQPLSYGLNMVNQLKPVDYIRKNNSKKTREIGFIAQDIEVLLKKLGDTQSGMLTTADNGRLSLRYNDFIPILTKAIQELSANTTRLEKQNKVLVQRIKALEEKNSINE